MGRFYEPDLGRNPDDPFARDAEGKLIRRSFWLDMSDRSLVLAMTQGVGAALSNDHKRARRPPAGRHGLSGWGQSRHPGLRGALPAGADRWRAGVQLSALFLRARLWLRR